MIDDPCPDEFEQAVLDSPDLDDEGKAFLLMAYRWAWEQEGERRLLE